MAFTPKAKIGISALVLSLAMGTGVQAGDLGLIAPYVEFGAGGNWQQLEFGNVETTSSDPITVTEVDNLGLGADVYAAIGASLMPGLRAELEASYRSNTGARFDITAEGSASVTADSHTFMVLANLWKDFELTEGMTFSLGAGLGAGSSQQTAESGAYTTELTTTGVAYMAGAGIGFDIGSGMVLGVKYTVSGLVGDTTGTVALDSSDNDDEDMFGDLSSSVNQSITVGLRIPVGP